MTGPAPWQPIVGAIGPKVAEARKRLGLSLQQLAARADVSAAAIHKVERGDMVPTVTTLLKLASALERPIAHFVDDGLATPVAMLVRRDERGPAPADWAPSADGARAAAFAVPSQRLRAGGVAVEIAPGGRSGDTRPLRPGEQVVLVTEGTLAVDVGAEQYVLGPGDALHHPTDHPHAWHNPGPEPARALWFTVRG